MILTLNVKSVGANKHLIGYKRFLSDYVILLQNNVIYMPYFPPVYNTFSPSKGFIPHGRPTRLSADDNAEQTMDSQQI